MVHPSVDAVDDDADAVAELVGEPLVDQAADDRCPDLLAMKAEGFYSALLAARGERPVDRLHDVATLPELPHGRLEPVGERPYSGLGLAGQPIAFQGLQAADAERAVEVAVDLAGLGPQVQHQLLGLRQHGAVDAGEALGRDHGRKLDLQLPVGLRAKLQGGQLLRPQPHAVGDVVLGDDEVLALIVVPADDDVAVRVTGIEVVDRDPVQPRAQILLHLPHHVTGEGTQVREVVAVLRGDDEAELVAVLPAALGEGLAVRLLGLGAIEPAALPITRRAVALKVKDVGVGSPAAQLEAHDPRLDHDPAHALARATLTSRELQPIRHRLAAADPGAPSLLGPCPHAAALPLPAHLGQLQRTAIGPGGRSHDLSHKGSRPWVHPGATITHAARSWAEVEGVVAAHARQIAPRSEWFKLKPAHIVL